MTRTLTFRYALTAEGIVADCAIDVDENGRIAAVRQGGPPYDGDLALPAMGNAHSHAFQRALCGRGETRRGEDSFWSWREAMYGLAARITPEQMYAVACQAYAEMLGAGFTAVAEFHYLHHLPDGSRSTEMADAVIAAARATGIRLRLLPVYYHTGGFDEPARPEQARFVHGSVAEYLELLGSIDHPFKGFAPHSLRAVPLAHLQELEAAAATDGSLLHIHIAEQEAEVARCLAVHGARPVELLARTVSLNGNWVLVHATHADLSERRLIRASRACVAICPLTEAYLGDGLFEAAEHHHAGGVWAVGTDSNVRIDCVEELRLLEYGQRLRSRRRAQLADERGIGLPLWRAAAAGGALATGFPLGVLAPGHYADLLVLSATAAPWAGLADPTRWLDAWLTGGSRHDTAAVFVGGERVAEAGRHRAAEALQRAFARAIAELTA